MSFDQLEDLNWLAVVVAGVAYFALGAIWYMPAMFGRAWMRAGGIQMEGQRQSSAMYVAPLVTCLIAAVATGMLALATATNTYGEGVVLGLVVGVGYAVTVSAVNALFDPQKPQQGVWFVINGGYHLVGLLIASVIIAVWE